MRRPLKILVLMVSFMLATAAAQAVSPFVWFAGAQIINDIRAKQPTVETPGVNPFYTVYSGGSWLTDGCYVGGHFEGDCQDPRTQVCRVARGAIVVVQPGVVAEGDVMGMDITSTSPYFFVKKGIYHQDFLKNFGGKVSFCAATDRVIGGDPRLGKYEIAFSTENLPFGSYQFTVWIWTVKDIRGGLGMWHYGEAKKTPALCRFRVASQQEMSESANDIRVQRDLAVSEGLQGGPPQASQNRVVITPETVQKMIDAGLVQVQGQQDHPVMPLPSSTPEQPVTPTQPAQTALTNEQIQALINARSAQNQQAAPAMDGYLNQPTSRPRCNTTMMVWIGRESWSWPNMDLNPASYRCGQRVNLQPFTIARRDGCIRITGGIAQVKSVGANCIEFILLAGRGERVRGGR